MEDPAVGVENVFTSFMSRPGANEQDASMAETSYHTYPASRPFINTDYQRAPSRPIMSFPESNRDGVLSALRNLQERMQKLEVERRDAENNLRTLASETEAYKTSLRQRSQPVDSFRPTRQEEVQTDEGPSASNGVGNTRPRARELESQLSSAETRCQLLEKQLDYMRKMVQSAERDRVEAVQKAEVLQQQQQHQDQHSPRPFSPDYCAQLERISELERDHLRLTATQTLAESKIKELENKLKEERDHRRSLQERALDLESAAVSHQILLNSAPLSEREPPETKGKSKKPPAPKKKKKLVSRKQVPVKPEPSKHYRLNLADIPFVAGKSTGPSYAVGANVQKVLALMKSHNLALCSSLYNGHSHDHGESGGGGRRSVSPSLSSTSSLSLDQDLTDLLAQLQDEFGQLSCEHQELLRQAHEERDPQIREDIEREMDIVLERMEGKGQQISRVRQHQQKLEDTKRHTKHSSKKAEQVPRPSSAMGRLQVTHRHPSCHGSDHGKRVCTRPGSSGRNEKDAKYQEFAHPSLNVLRDMRKLQSTLRRDDLCWE
ncbi:centrosomal protein of 57 kDa-like [Babylonia areolata]|uniref:centrosomal protein of 57 kDa-like n=1 Tax=Babylonia areolata TaxID=304850 RepID=UPI003FD09CBA